MGVASRCSKPCKTVQQKSGNVRRPQALDRVRVQGSYEVSAVDWEPRRAWAAPFNPSGVVAEAAELLKSYRCHEVTGDRYAGEWPREAFRSHAIEYQVAELDRSKLYLELLPVVNAGTIELPDAAKLLAELRGLERRRGTAGRDRVDHRPGSFDDRANACVGVAWLVGQSIGTSGGYSMGGIADPERPEQWQRQTAWHTRGPRHRGHSRRATRAMDRHAATAAKMVTMAIDG